MSTTKIVELKHGQEIRIKGFSKYAQRITVGTVRGYAIISGCNPDAEEALCRANQHPEVWTNQEAAMLTEDYPGKAERLNAERAATAAAPEVQEGQTVQIEGRQYLVKVLGEQYANPAAFIPVTISKKPDYTPGPWITTQFHNVMDKDGSRVAHVEMMPGQDEEQRAANARLIAAAPALLSALQGLLDEADLGEVTEETQPLVDAARAAITAATGNPA
jgi:hypothetical protein